MNLKSSARALTPPVLWALLHRLRQGWSAAGPEWEHVPEGWDAAVSRCHGWNVPDVAATQRARWPSWTEHLRGTQPLDWGHESPGRGGVAQQDTHLVFAYALALAARGRDRISMLDWGGGPGHYGEIARVLMPGLEVDYHCRDLPLLVALGRELLPGDTFHDGDAWRDRSYDLVCSSSSLQYSPDWRATLAALAAVTRGYLLVSRLPTTVGAASWVFVQRAYAYGYGTEYAGWCVAQEELREAAGACGLVVVREFLIAEEPRIARAPDQCRYHAWLFRPATT